MSLSPVFTETGSYVLDIYAKKKNNLKFEGDVFYGGSMRYTLYLYLEGFKRLYTIYLYPLGKDIKCKAFLGKDIKCKAF